MDKEGAVGEKWRGSSCEYMERENMEWWVFIVEYWDDEDEDEGRRARKMADSWTNTRTVDENGVSSNWEVAGL